jgi:hypothetical protein
MAIPAVDIRTVVLVGWSIWFLVPGHLFSVGPRQLRESAKTHKEFVKGAIAGPDNPARLPAGVTLPFKSCQRRTPTGAHSPSSLVATEALAEPVRETDTDLTVGSNVKAGLSRFLFLLVF